MFNKIALLAIVLLAYSALALAGGLSPSGTITSYNVGWSADQVRVTTTVSPIYNPDGCTSADGYITSPSDPGNHAYQAALLAAYVAGKSVTLQVSGCFIGRPQIVGVNVSG